MSFPPLGVPQRRICPVLRQAFRRICNPPSKNDLTTLCSGDMLSPASRQQPAYRWDRGDCKSPGLIGRTFFTTDCKSVGTPNGGGTSNLRWSAQSGLTLSMKYIFEAIIYNASPPRSLVVSSQRATAAGEAQVKLFECLTDDSIVNTNNKNKNSK